MIVHLNPLQECLQPEGTPRNSKVAFARLKSRPRVGNSVIVKETGCGISEAYFKNIKWYWFISGRCEWLRRHALRAASKAGEQKPAALSSKHPIRFRNWGISTVDSLLDAVAIKADYRVWASGGVRVVLMRRRPWRWRSMVGLANRLLKRREGEVALDRKMEALE